MLITLIIIIIGFLPCLWSFWAMRQYQRRMRNHRNRIRQNISEYIPTIAIDHLETDIPSDRYYLEGVGYLIGDISCKFNAKSSYIRCAVNPTGPCEDCNYYEHSSSSKNST